MIRPELPKNEQERLKNLETYRILDTLPEQDFDDLTRIASQICETPISLIGLIDDKRQWYKSKYGIEGNEAPRDLTFCAHAIMSGHEVMMVPDSRLDERFFDNPMVLGDPHVIFYTGVPLVSTEGFALGTLCVIDKKPKTLNQEQLFALKALSNQIIRLFDLRKSQLQLEGSKELLIAQNIKLDRFASIAAHDLKSPLNGITGLSRLLLDYFSEGLSPQMMEMLSQINTSSQNLSQLVSGILTYSNGAIDHLAEKEEIQLGGFFSNLIQLIDAEKKYNIRYTGPGATILASKTLLQQLFINLISNAIKYNDKDCVVIEIGFSEKPGFYSFYVKDNGQGIKEESLVKIFDIFHVGAVSDRFGQKGNGIGLATVKKIVEEMGGQIMVASELGVGTTFTFSLAG